MRPSANPNLFPNHCPPIAIDKGLLDFQKTELYVCDDDVGGKGYVAFQNINFLEDHSDPEVRRKRRPREKSPNKNMTKQQKDPKQKLDFTVYISSF